MSKSGAHKKKRPSARASDEDSGAQTDRVNNK